MTAKTPKRPTIRTYVIEGIKSMVREPQFDNFIFITITLNPKLYKYNADTQYKRSINHLRTAISSADDYCIITELTKDANVHYHGWLSMDTQQTLELIDFLKTNYAIFGFHKISKPHMNKPLNEQQKDIYNYMIKDIRSTYNLIRTRSICINKQDTILDDIDDIHDRLMPVSVDIDLKEQPEICPTAVNSPRQGIIWEEVNGIKVSYDDANYIPILTKLTYKDKDNKEFNLLIPKK